MQSVQRLAAGAPMARETVVEQLADKRLTRLPGGHCRIDSGALALVILRCLGRKLEGRYVGTDGDNLLIFRLPVVPRLKERLLVDNGVVVKYERQGCIYQFQTHALRLIYRPVPMLFVALPTSIFRIDLRATPRVACMLPVTLRGRVGEHEGVICDLSEQGILAKFKITGSTGLRKVMPGDRFAASFSLGDTGAVMPGVTVRRIQSGMDTVSLGLHISEIREAEAQAVKGYLDKVLCILH